MVRHDAGTTNPALLERLGDWRDHEAWVDFVTRYDPVIRSVARQYRLDADSMEEVCQRVWIDLARRMRTYQCAPGKTFRGWLRRLCYSRAIDVLRKRKAQFAESLDEQLTEALLEDPAAGIEIDEGDTEGCSVLLAQAEEVQGAVRRRVNQRTWQIFWNIAVEGQSIGEAALAGGISYYAAFAALKRATGMLREEGRHFLAQRRLHDSETPRSGD
jgi:RNA polymerase sigma-70 factor (ECF subfamily)